MKATGIIRRIDDLGRIVVPKEIRKSLRINEGDNLEIYIDNDENIILKKYSPVNKIEDFAQNYVDTIHNFIKKNVLITNTDTVVSASTNIKKKYINKSISKEMIECLKRKGNIIETKFKDINIVDNEKINCTYIINPIFVYGDIAGLVIIFSHEEVVGVLEKNVVNIASHFLGKYLEN